MVAAQHPYTSLETYLARERSASEKHEYVQHGDVLLNPTVLIEVISPSTAAYDRSAKFEHYRSIPTLQEYVLIAQDARKIERFARQASGEWMTTVVEGEGIVTLESIACTLALDDVYAKAADAL